MSANKKNIAIVIDTLNGGGAEKVCLVLAKHMKNLGANVSLIVLKKHCDYTLPKNLDVRFIFNDRKTRLFKKINQHIAAEKVKEISLEMGGFDLVLSNLDGAHPVCKLASLENTWYVVHNSIDEKLRRAFWLGPVKYLKQKKIYSLFNGENVVAVSRGLESELLAGRKVKPRRIVQIYNPLDLEEIDSLKNAFTPSLSEPYIVHVGRFAKMKRHDILFSAFRKIDANVKLVLLSNNTQKLAKAVAKAGLQDQVVIPGFQQNPYPWLKHAKALVLSSDAEGFGMVLVEALACGTPVVSTKCKHGPDEILCNELAAYLCAVGDVDALANTIENVLKNPPDIVRLKEAKKLKILQEINAESIAKAYLKLAN